MKGVMCGRICPALAWKGPREGSGSDSANISVYSVAGQKMERSERRTKERQPGGQGCPDGPYPVPKVAAGGQGTAWGVARGESGAGQGVGGRKGGCKCTRQEKGRSEVRKMAVRRVTPVNVVGDSMIKNVKSFGMYGRGEWCGESEGCQDTGGEEEG